MNKEIEIPEGYEARIEGNKVIIERKESEDERIREWLIRFVEVRLPDAAEFEPEYRAALAWLERQKEQNEIFDVDKFFVGKDVTDFKKELFFLIRGARELKPTDEEIWLNIENQIAPNLIDILQKEQMSHLELKAGKWYICHRAFCARADHLTVKEGERFQCEKDGIVKGFVIKEPERYFKECSAPEPMEKEQKPVEWSEEDKEMLRIISNRLEKFNEWATEQGYPIDDPTMKQSPIDWLKSLRPQPHWKPSEEQMEALSDAYAEARTFKMADILESLHQDLEKL